MILNKNKKQEKDFLSHIETESTNHPDEVLREFYRAFLYLYNEESNKRLISLMHTLFDKRTDITTSHLVNLLYRAFQYILVFRHNNKELNNYDINDWIREYRKVLDSNEDFAKYEELLLTENTQTTIYQRYAGPKAALRAVFGDKPLILADIGCGLNVGLPGIQINKEFTEIEDNTDEGMFTTALTTGINTQRGIAVDIQDPIMKKHWALACGFYPKEIVNMEYVTKMYEEMWNMSQIEFHLGSALELFKVWERNNLPKIDAAIASTILYQFSEDDRYTIMSEIRKILKDDGILIINDFVHTDGTITWKSSWFKGNKPAYSTVVLENKGDKFGDPIEFVKWDNGRCRIVTPGKHFDEIIKLGESKGVNKIVKTRTSRKSN